MKANRKWESFGRRRPLHMKMGASCQVLFGKDNSPIQTGQKRRLQVAGLILMQKKAWLSQKGVDQSILAQQ